LKIDQAASMGLCKKACNFGRDGRCNYHDLPGLNYRDAEPGECALTPEEIVIMKKEHVLGGR